MLRVSEDATWLSVAGLVAMRGTCSRLRVGAILVKKGRPISSGWNGAPSGMEHCDHTGPESPDAHCQTAIHAERNAVGWAARAAVGTDGAIMYCTHMPCQPCATVLIASGIRKVVYREIYQSTAGGALLEKSGIIVQRGCVVAAGA